MPEERTTASLLLAFALGVDRLHIIAHPERMLTAGERDAYRSAISRRADGVPFQYITGVQEFYGLDFEVAPGVLIPRPETEAIVDAAIRLWPGEGRLVDVGAGSGCLAITLATRLDSARVFATDISDRALAIARRNADRHGARVAFLRGDLLTAISGPVEMIVSNPPYVPDGEIPSLQREVRDHEPRSALAGGPDGLDCYRRLFGDASRVLAPGGYLICEFGLGQEGPVERLATGHNLKVVEVLNDLAGIPRTLTLVQAFEQN